MQLVNVCRTPLLAALPLVALLNLGNAASAVVVVNVDLRNAQILNNVARDLDIAVNNVPVTVQAPINLAAQICGVTVDILARAYRRGGATCSAQQTSRAFNQVVRQVVNLQQ